MNQNSIVIRPETPPDYAAVEHLTREAFWNVYRPGCLEHYVVHVLRHDPAFVPELDLVMEREGELIGHVLYTRSFIAADDGRCIPTMTFGPISIRPDLQRQGLGKYLLDRSMERAAELGAGPLFCASRAGNAINNLRRRSRRSSWNTGRWGIRPARRCPPRCGRSCGTPTS